MSEKRYEVVIIGGGPAGLTAGLYAARAGLRTLLIEKGIFGGQITFAEQVENFPAFPQGISGMEIGERLHEQATRFGLNVELTEATELTLSGKVKTVKTVGDSYSTSAVILAGGSVRKKLNVPGEETYLGKGVSYCATCDSAFFVDKKVMVVGGGDASLTEALHLARHASSVAVIHRRSELRATRILQDRAFAEKKISFVWDSVVEAVEGAQMVTHIKLQNVKTKTHSLLETDGVFVSVGFDPATELVKGKLELDEFGQIITNEKMETSLPGVLAAGDIRRNSGRQAVTAAGDGATAAIYAQKYLLG